MSRQYSPIIGISLKMFPIKRQYCSKIDFTFSKYFHQYECDIVLILRINAKRGLLVGIYSYLKLIKQFLYCLFFLFFFFQCISYFLCKRKTLIPFLLNHNIKNRTFLFCLNALMNCTLCDLITQKINGS